MINVSHIACHPHRLMAPVHVQAWRRGRVCTAPEFSNHQVSESRRPARRGPGGDSASVSLLCAWLPFPFYARAGRSKNKDGFPKVVTANCVTPVVAVGAVHSRLFVSFAGLPLPNMASLAPLSARMPGSPRNGAKLSPLSLMRSESARLSTTSAQVRGGGRLYAQSPIAGYTEQEMIKEAKLRLEHNKQRIRLKQLLNVASEGGPTVNTQDLLLACQLAKLPMETQKVLSSPFGVNHDQGGSPKKVLWKNFHETLEYPKLHGHGAWGENLPPLRKTRREMAKLKALQDAATAGAPSAAETKIVASDEEVKHHFAVLKRLMETRFSEMRRAFRLIDEDASGTCDRGELKFMLNAMFNLTIPDHVLDRLIDLADFDGDGTINFAEFCRLMTAEDVLNMKKTLVADTSAWGAKAPETSLTVDYGDLAAQNRKMAAGGYEGGEVHAKLRRTGPGIAALRKAHQTLKKAILARYDSVKAAFQEIDKDGSGTLRRGELKAFMRQLSKSIPDRVMSGLIDFCDSDGDAKSLSIEEFCGVSHSPALSTSTSVAFSDALFFLTALFLPASVQMLEADVIGAGGYDPNAPAQKK